MSGPRGSANHSAEISYRRPAEPCLVGANRDDGGVARNSTHGDGHGAEYRRDTLKRARSP